MAPRRYQVFDVFTDKVLTGNPLAVVLDTDGLDTAAMQKIANEFNLSETTFILPATDPTHRARVRIFTPYYEMPFAGHPTVGSAIALAREDRLANEIFVLEEEVGPVRCAVRKEDGSLFAEFDLPRLPAPAPFDINREAAAAALGLSPHEIGFENHEISPWDAGVPYITIPVYDLDVAARARFDARLWLEMTGGVTEAKAPAAYVYCRQTVGHSNSFHARMFAGHVGLEEDPATGSAAAAFAGAIHHYDRPPDGMSRYWIEQGIEMGRPSRISLELIVEDGALLRARIGGNAVKVMEGMLLA